MYIPEHFREEDRKNILSFMREYNFATIISCNEQTPLATHLPFVIEERADKIFLISHLAKVNPHLKFLGKNELVIFQGPHAYISTKHYTKKENVPTWNYIAVHATGKARLITNTEDLIRLMETSIDAFDKDFKSQWKELRPEYLEGMLKAIVGIEIEVELLQAKYKLSQNKTEEERKKIINSLESTDDSVKKAVAGAMGRVK